LAVSLSSALIAFATVRPRSESCWKSRKFSAAVGLPRLLSIGLRGMVARRFMPKLATEP